MATRFAIASGNWSSAAIWDNGAVPVAGDDVYANGFTVTLDTNASVRTLRNDISNVIVPNIATPVMTSNTTPSGVVSASSAAGGAAAFGAFAQDSTTSFWESAIINTAWLSYQFSVAKTIRRYAFYTFTANKAPRTWTFEGSNDGAAWTVLDTQTNLTLTATTWYTYPIASPASYLYYRINITAVNVAGNAPLLAELQMTESSGTVLGNTANGTFNLNGGVTITCTLASGGIIAASSTAAVIAFTTGTSTINSVINTSSGLGAVYLNGTGTLTINGNITGNSAATQALVLVNAAGTLNINGNIVGGSNSVGRTILSNGVGSPTLNVVGDVTGNNHPAIQGYFATINITGNLAASGTQGVALQTGGNGGTITINGNLTAAGAIALVCAHTTNIIINGTLTASSTNAALSNSLTTTTVTLNGNMVNNINGVTAVFSPRMQISAAANQTWYMTTSGGADRTLYTTGLMPPSGGYPAVGDVRSGVSYGAGLYTGTCVIPAANTVALGVPVDTTFGTAVLPITVATQMWAEPVTNLTVAGSIGERLKNCATTDTTGHQIAALM